MEKAKQNAQYTFKYNKSLGRHGWLRLTPAYSVKIVQQIIENLDYKPQNVLEPFSGTGTTELVCANLGIPSVAYDINPFLAWFAETKTKQYAAEIIQEFTDITENIIEKIGTFNPCEYPPIYRIERWWGAKQLDFLARLKSAILDIDNASVRDLHKIAFCRTLISLSNAAFNHVSTSFKDSTENSYFDDSIGIEMYDSVCHTIAETAKIQPIVEPIIINANSMNLDSCGACFDTVITSPPYPNRISYIRELRPYMYWLDYLSSSDDASALDWETIGGTWGSATSKLSSWEYKSGLLPEYLLDIADNISKADNKSAELMAQYVLKYFDDIAKHLRSVYECMCDGGTVHYIVGNSNFYGNTVPSEKIYSDLLVAAGFQNASYQIVRKRNCNKELFEFLITAKK